jgi:hypothetical protein
VAARSCGSSGRLAANSSAPGGRQLPRKRSVTAVPARAAEVLVLMATIPPGEAASTDRVQETDDS